MGVGEGEKKKKKRRDAESHPLRLDGWLRGVVTSHRTPGRGLGSG